MRQGAETMRIHHSQTPIMPRHTEQMETPCSSGEEWGWNPEGVLAEEF